MLCRPGAACTACTTGTVGLARLRLSSIEPMTVPRELFPLMRDRGDILCPHLHLPVDRRAQRQRAGIRADLIAGVRDDPGASPAEAGQDGEWQSPDLPAHCDELTARAPAELT